MKNVTPQALARDNGRCAPQPATITPENVPDDDQGLLHDVAHLAATPTKTPRHAGTQEDDQETHRYSGIHGRTPRLCVVVGRIRYEDPFGSRQDAQWSKYYLSLKTYSASTVRLLDATTRRSLSLGPARSRISGREA